MKLFVYGTLLSPFAESSLIPLESVRRPAMVIGRMYHYLPGCYPAIVIPERLIQSNGTSCYDETIEKPQDPLDIESFDRQYAELSRQGFDWIYGELVEISNPDEVIPSVDRYEGFCGDNPLYRRSLVPVKTEQGLTFGWVYHFEENYPFDAESDLFMRVPEGDWVAFLQELSRAVCP